MRDISDRYHVQSISSLTSPKQIGGYLVEAGLLTHDQINVALNDQQATGMRFGEIIVARGWLKEQTVEWIVTKVIEPERQTVNSQPAGSSADSARTKRQAMAQVAAPSSSSASSSSSSSPVQPSQPAGRPPVRPSQSQPSSAEPQVAARITEAERMAQRAAVRREAPIAKPLPSVGSPDGDVNWVG